MKGDKTRLEDALLKVTHLIEKKNTDLLMVIRKQDEIKEVTDRLNESILKRQQFDHNRIMESTNHPRFIHESNRSLYPSNMLNSNISTSNVY